MQRRNSRPKIEFGDFQTPEDLVREICNYLYKQNIRPQSVVEPTCGKGHFLLGAMGRFDSADRFLGIERNRDYLDEARSHLRDPNGTGVELRCEDFFSVDWQNTLGNLPEPILIIGNPPWVTNSELGSLGSSNLPVKSNFQGHKGLDALTGKSNFDISEWMLIHLVEKMQGYEAFLAMLCKTTVARKVLRHIWRNRIGINQATIHIIDSRRAFNASVDACLLVCKTGDRAHIQSCQVYDGFSGESNVTTVGMHNGEILADMGKYRKWSRLDGVEHYKWRSGVKHDCAKVMELVSEGTSFRNGFGEIVDIEHEFLYPLYKSSDIAKDETAQPRRWVIITQRNIGDHTKHMKDTAPKTWSYLMAHADRLDKRRSSIYKGKPRFSIFGIGEYSFASWKVAISGLYKKVHFSVVPPTGEKPGMVDDTCYFIPCRTEDEARVLAEILNSSMAKEFLSSLIFWDSKRPITADVLRRIDLVALAEELGKKDRLDRYLCHRLRDSERQLALL